MTGKVNITAARKPLPAWRKYLPLVGLALLAWILYRADRTAMLNALRLLSWKSVALAAVFFGANVLLKSVRWSRMLSAQGIPLPVRVAVAAYLNGQFYGQITVGRIGEFYRAEALIERNVSAGRALSSCLWDRFLDVLTVLFVAATLSATVVGDYRSAGWAAMMLVVLAAGGLAMVFAIEYALHPTKSQNRLKG